MNRNRSSAISTRSATTAAAILLAIYVAMYFAVAMIVHVLTGPDATAAVVPVAPASVPPRPDESPLRVSLIQVLDQLDNARECSPRDGVDTQCTFN